MRTNRAIPERLAYQEAHTPSSTDAELALVMIMLAHCWSERQGGHAAASTIARHPYWHQDDDLGDEFDEIDHELDRAKIQRWLIVILNIALSILIEIVF